MPGVAVIDCGSNSTRLLIKDHVGMQLERELRTTRLAEGVDASRTLTEPAIKRTIDAITEFMALVTKHGITDLRVVATSAARDAGNRVDFERRVNAVTGTNLRILSGSEEGLATYRGATAGLHTPPYLVLDIGGGSTELALGAPNAEGKQSVEAISLDIGSVRLTEQILRSDPYSPDELTNAFSLVEEMMGDASLALPVEAYQPRLIGVAGTITSVAAIDLGLTSYEPTLIHHHVLKRSAVEDLFRSLSMQGNRERCADPTMPANRADIIVAGMIILLGVMRHFDFEESLVSETDILDGIAHPE